MKSFATPDEFFAAVESLVASLEQRGERGAAEELRDGFSCLNGLTDGYALFRDSIDRIRRDRLNAAERDSLSRIRKFVHRAVTRR